MIEGLIPILDNGHGGLINGEYFNLAGGRKVVTKDYHFYEGEFNRSIVNRITEQFALKGVPYYVLVPEHTDVIRSDRINRTNLIYKHNPDTYLFSIHSNAGKGTGFEIFTSVGPTKSDPLATIVGATIEEMIPEYKWRKDYSDGDLDKERNFDILKYTKCPAMLLECLFFDNASDIRSLISIDFRNRLATVIAKALMDLYYGVDTRV